jgi:membrane protein
MPEKPSPALVAAIGAAGLLAAAFQRGEPDLTPVPLRPGRRRQRTLAREAETPAEAPPRGWWPVLKRTAQQANADRLLTEAAGVTFFTLLALFPGIAALVSLYGLFADPATIWRHFSILEGLVPGGGMEVLQDQVQRIAEKGSGSLGFSLALSLATSLWSANQAIKALFDALNVVFEEKETRGFFRLTAETLGFTFASLVFVLLAIAAVVALPVALAILGLGAEADLLLRVSRWPLLLLTMTVFLACVYRFGPDRRQAKWRWVTWGGAAASVLWVVVSGAFSFYVAQFGTYNATYGSLGAVIGFMTWIWLSSAVLLLGAELDAELEQQAARDSAAPGARMADRVAG